MPGKRKDKDDSGANSYYTILNDKGGQMTINSGVTVLNDGHYSSMIRNGGDSKSTTPSKLTINGGTFTGGLNTVKNDELGELTIYGGDFSNTSQFVVMNWHKATIEAGTFAANASAEAVLFSAEYDQNRAVGELTVKGGNFKGTGAQPMITTYYSDDYIGTAKVSGGYFTSDPSAYCVTGKTGVGSGNVEYPFTIGDVVADAKPATVDTATVPAKTASEDDTVKAAASAIQGATMTNTAAAEAATKDLANENKIVADETVTENLNKATSGSNTAENVAIVYQTYVDIVVSDAKAGTDNKITDLEVNLTPMYRVVATTKTVVESDTNIVVEGAGVNAVVIEDGKKLSIPTATYEVNLNLPRDFAAENGAKLSIKHIKDNGTVEYYTGIVTETSGTKTLTFTTNGFSPFVISAPVASIGENVYPTLQAAVDAAKDGETVEVTGGTNPYSATMSGSSRTITVKNGTAAEIDVTINGTKETIAIGKTATFSYTAPVYAPITKKDAKFDDVDVNAYYAPAVKWAVENKITAGKTDKLFAPDDTCTRGEMITFLWNAAGKPAAKNTTNPFTDVNAGAFYYDAVLWAVSNGITSGTSETTFSPDNTVSRAQVVAFLYNYANKPAAANSTFSDVAADAYYAPAVGWAAAQKITSGTGNNTFSPENDCTRAQIVTFLYNDLAK